ncbi:MAG: Rrf2 family transcriptional regulator [Calditrichaeota bacterium]|nr:Rrf2 family transcriptional regulator [Calditrichota bacterium]
MVKNVLIKREYDYAVRICAYLAGQKANAPIPLSQITRLLAISRPFASKIVFQLRKAGLIGTAQGKYGGIFLNRNPRRISVLDVLEAMNFDSTVNECLRNPAICPLIGYCKTHLFFKEQEEQMLKNFSDKKISELVFYDHDINPNYEKPE